MIADLGAGARPCWRRWRD